MPISIICLCNSHNLLPSFYDFAVRGTCASRSLVFPVGKPEFGSVSSWNCNDTSSSVTRSDEDPSRCCFLRCLFAAVSQSVLASQLEGMNSLQQSQSPRISSFPSSCSQFWTAFNSAQWARDDIHQEKN